MDNREHVDFYQRNNSGIKTKRTGIKIGEHLAITYASVSSNDRLQIFSIISGKPVISVSFPSTHLEYAIKIAEWMDTIYHDYWDLWIAIPDGNIPLLTRYTVDNGILMSLTFEKLEKLPHPITQLDMKKAWEVSLQELPEYERFLRPR